LRTWWPLSASSVYCQLRGKKPIAVFMETKGEMRTKIQYTKLIAMLLLLPIIGQASPVLPKNTTGRDSSAHCEIRLDGFHHAVTSLEILAPIPPVAVASCGDAVKLSFEDQYFQLGCIVSGFKDYFALSRWAAHTIKGDVGVDVTGAPNSILVEGANTASVVAAPESEASVQIAIPADGFVAFDWRHVGGSTFSHLPFWVDINGERADDAHADQQSGSFFFGPLAAGDLLGLHVLADSESLAVELSNFTFHSNAMGVLERRWKAVSAGHLEAVFTQLVSVKKPNLSLVVFPGNYDGFEYPALSWGESIHPEWTGYPVLDEDGLLSTTHDQHSLRESAAPFNFSWRDEVLYDDAGNWCSIFREWTVADECGGNILLHIQHIKLQGACPEEPRPAQYEESWQATPRLRETREDDASEWAVQLQAEVPDHNK
jgi:hypothetical protein